MKTVFTYTSVLILVLLTQLLWGNESDAPVFRAGAAQTNITPWLGLSLAGHMRDRKIARVHDELHAKSVVFDDGTNQLAIVMVDSCMVPREIFDAAKQRVHETTGLPLHHMMMAATHTHTAPCSTPVFQSDSDPHYNQFLTLRIADAVLLAMENLTPAKVGWGHADLAEEVFNRRWKMKPGSIAVNPFGDSNDQVKMNPPRGSADLVEPAGPIDPEISILAVQHLDGSPLALLANYSLHYVGGTGPNETSADYFGMFADKVTELIAEDNDAFIAMLSNGTSGNINNIDFRVKRVPQNRYEQMSIVADKVAVKVFAAYRRIAFVDGVELEAVQQEMTLGVRLPTADDVFQAEEIMAAAASPEMNSMQEIYARETVLLSQYPSEVKLILQAFRLGEVMIGAIPCEVFVETGLELKQTSPSDHTFIIELANGYNGYLPTPEQHALGGYETWRARSSYLEVDASEKITGVMQKLFGQLR